MLERELFLDAAYLIALAVPADQHHARAKELMARVNESSSRLFTTQAILLEVGDALSKPNNRARAHRLLTAMEADSGIEIFPLTDALYSRGLTLFSQRPDKEWSLTDCVSFVVMEERQMRQALTTDLHFEQAGFIALLRN